MDEEGLPQRLVASRNMKTAPFDVLCQREADIFDRAGQVVDHMLDTGNFAWDHEQWQDTIAWAIKDSIDKVIDNRDKANLMEALL